MSKKREQYIVRFPEGLREKIKESAAENRRSMNSEIITMLESVVGKTETKKGGEAAA